jgi:CTP:molybdopterin cytidylyltransferase MocA
MDAQPMAATILAAGLGRRLGHRPKAALRIGGVSLLERLIDALRGAGIADVSVVVGGAHAPALLPLVARAGARALPHAQLDTSLIDSQRLALQGHDAHHRDHDLALVLADLPWLEAVHIKAMRDAWQDRPSAIQAQMPVVDGVRGHPLLLSAEGVQRVLATPPEAGIRDWLAAHRQWVRTVHTAQRAHVSDLDTPQDLALLTAWFSPQTVSWPD